ncbi:cytochrome P450 [Aspergillus campestris IBT 28561]|uniref:Cytochrome P450 n=1 Tax=Aspergillus campestris (strain IBT 28561) TaxID=1392248 RepID=A0A2I1DA36_ASPC2|nr:cytochrome P450 [Aspergillus campestris IBT 28561]PKY06744.1 cytochrome P450 [Aspergillus campestris IBT 28561]
MLPGYANLPVPCPLTGSNSHKVDVPVVGDHGAIGAWIAAYKWERNARHLIQEGYEKHRDYAFQVATPSRWEVWICNDQMVKEYKNLMDEDFSANAVTADLFQTAWTLPGAAENVHKIPIPLLHKGLTWQRGRSLAKDDPYFQQFVTEFFHAWEVETNITGDGWNELCCYEIGTRIVAHLTAKSLVGYPLCRDPELIDLFAAYGNAVPISGFFISMFPEFMKPFVARFCQAPKMASRLDQMFLDEMERRAADPPKEPGDIMDWTWQYTEKNEPGVYQRVHIARSITSSVFGAIHTTTQVLAHCLFELAVRSEYVDPLRQEVEQAFESHNGWTKSAIESMPKLDSFVKECQRFNPLDSGSLARRATRDFEFKNGLKIPQGTFVFSPNAPVLFDERYYPNASEFDGYRFYKLGLETGKPADHKFVSTNPRYLQFGDARHTCPGRHMAADEIRLMLAHILRNYHISTKDHGPRPGNWFFKKILFPDMSGLVVLKPRQAGKRGDVVV